MSDAPSMAQLKVTLDDVEPAVMRRLIVPLQLRMDRLHEVLQLAVGWTNSHLWEFQAGDTGWGVPDPNLGFGGARWMPARRRFGTCLRTLGPASWSICTTLGTAGSILSLLSG